MPALMRLSRPLLLILLLIFALLWFLPLDYRKLVKSDEGRYAEIPREMLVTGDWLTPRLNGIKYFEKPPLQYWATAATYSVFGESEWTSRLWPALTGFLGVLFTIWASAILWGRRLPRAALYSGLILGSSVLYVLIGHVDTLDMGTSFFLASAVFAFTLAQRDEASPRATRHWMWAAWALLAFAMLSKGLIAVVLPGATLVLYSLWQRDFALWKRLHLVSGLALFLLISAPWFIAVSLKNPEFARFFFIHEHFERFLTKTHHRYQPMWFFVPILLAGILPWLIALFGGLASGLRREVTQRFQPTRFLFVWCALVFAFFSVSDSKLIGYILPIFPALAALMGYHLAKVGTSEPRSLRWHALSFVALGAVTIALAPQVLRAATNEVPAALYQAFVPWIIAAGAALALGGTYAWLQASRSNVDRAMLGLAFGGLLFNQIAISGSETLAPANSGYNIAQAIRPYVTPDVPFYSVGMYEQTLQPYLQRTTQMVAYADELEFGIGVEPHKFIPTVDEFEQRWRATNGQAFALMAPSMYQQLQQHGLPMYLLAQDTRRVVVTRQAIATPAVVK